MRSWVPVPGTTTGRLVVVALDLFGASGFAAVSVADIAEQAGVTTGALYHHFGSKSGLYRLVRTDVEQRVIDRLEGAVSIHPITTVADLAPVLLVGFDYLVTHDLARILAQEPPDGADDVNDHRDGDPIEGFVRRALPRNDDPFASLVAAAWREALRQASEGAGSAARRALATLLCGRE